ncbi:hypothetical protein HCU64_14280 [Methylobacterium sp. C25]|uniref:hypothetical protein n=1 Tax=Methylobacterium sp. C25 TaxID=2721622 RepID=UPI001F48F365|nr:hypothetical protein [Methylobacterium sp. C25]MCE4224926.1 hypothetical protein [Methylobacterium sp. C25]
MGQAFVGFYWSLPVPRRPVRTWPRDVEAAARLSRTIRYQLTLVRRYVTEQRGRLLDEAAFLELAVDRGTDAVAEALARPLALCAAEAATLVYVDFSLVHHWRPHGVMQEILDDAVENRGIRVQDLRPDPTPIEGMGSDFDPVKHFRRWQRRQSSEARATRARAKEEVTDVVSRLPEGAGRWSAAADELNKRGVATMTGRRWTAEGVRKTSARLTREDT